MFVEREKRRAALLDPPKRVVRADLVVRVRYANDRASTRVRDYYLPHHNLIVDIGGRDL
jgi:hypothetical protein